MRSRLSVPARNTLIFLIGVRRPSRRWLRVSLVLTTSMSACLAGLIQIKVWRAEPGVASKVALLTLISALALSCWDLFHETQRKRRSERDRDAIAGARAVLLSVHIETKVPASDVGVSVFVVKGRLLPRLSRVHSERLLGVPAPSHIVWTKGKGVIGKCWAFGDTRDTVVDLRELARTYARRAPTAAEFESVVQTGLDLGLSHQEFSQMINKYGEVFAVCIKDQAGRPVGVLAADISATFFDGNPSSGTVLTGRNVRTIMHKSARDLGASALGSS